MNRVEGWHVRTRRTITLLLPITLVALSMVTVEACRPHSPFQTQKAETAPTERSSPQAKPERMVDFTLKDTSGRQVSLSQFRGQVLLVDFWATWCGPCKKEMPGYEELYRRYRDRGFVVLGIALDSDAKTVIKFAQELSITYPLLINGMDVSRFGVLGIPATFLIDRKGIIRKKVVGFEYKEVIEAALKEIL